MEALVCLYMWAKQFFFLEVWFDSIYELDWMQRRGANIISSTNLCFLEMKDHEDSVCSIEVKRLRKLTTRPSSRI